MNAAKAKTKTTQKTKTTSKTDNVEKPIAKKAKVSKVVEKVVEEVNEEVPIESTDELVAVAENTTKQVGRESILEGFDKISQMIETEITNLRESSQKQKGIKFLRSLNKMIKVLRTQSTKVLKRKTKNMRKNNSNSGFLKPVQISEEMAKFTGWDSETPRSRVEVTKYICDYITQHNLQNPSDRRQIQPDDKLKRLLALKGNEDLRYYSLQTHLKKHFPKPVTA